VAILLGRVLEARLHGVSPADPLTHAAVAALLLVTALAAVWLPARRAAAAEPMGVLREE
jgi:ABC-type lipoprotein release transport system permease subunit